MHRSLAILFGLLWLLVASNLLVNPEVWPHGPMARLMAAAPPIVPVVMLLWSKGWAAAITWVLTALVVVGWVAAARQPTSLTRRVLARAGIVVYWLLLWFGLGVSA